MQPLPAKGPLGRLALRLAILVVVLAVAGMALVAVLGVLAPG